MGSSYSIFDEPEFVRERKSDRSGYLYRSEGEVKIVGVKDDLYIGIVTTAYGVVTRGMKLYPLLPLVTDVKPIAARTALEALVVMSNDISTRNTAQFRLSTLIAASKMACRSGTFSEFMTIMTRLRARKSRTVIFW